ncbi:MAG: lipoprotein-releasing ABC transporter ATP-binding protein LolD [Gammaproteobacteria bacterium]
MNEHEPQIAVGEAVVVCEDLVKRFAQGPLSVEVLNGVSLRIMPGEKVAIVGASGSGKSTLLHLLGGLDVPTSGSVVIGGEDMSRLSDAKRGLLRNRMLGFVYQFHHLLPELTALENVALPLIIGGSTSAAGMEHARVLLEKVGMAGRLGHKPGELSGGERQRTAIGRALITEPRLVLADEPTGNLDRKTAGQIHQLMLHLNNELSTSLIIVTHDPGLAEKMDKVYTLEDGQLHRG